MAKKRRKERSLAAPPESQASVFVTVAWTLSVMTTLVCTCVAGLVWIVVRDRADNETALAFSRLLHFSAIVTGAVSLVLLAAVVKVRREPPPAGLVVVAIIVAALPIAAALF